MNFNPNRAHPTMQIKLLDALRKLQAGVKSTTPDTEVAAALTKFCKTYGNDVVVERHNRQAGAESSKRKFLIFFESSNEATEFAYEATLETHGHEGVMVEMA